MQLSDSGKFCKNTDTLFKQKEGQREREDTIVLSSWKVAEDCERFEKER